MITKQALLAVAASDPAELRHMMLDPEVQLELEALGIQIRTFELHAPSPKANKKSGVGLTLCKRRGRRHPTVVTCKNCLKRIGGP